MKKQKASVIITAAGMGKRMNSKKNKQFLLLDSKPILSHTIEKFENNENISNIIIVINKNDKEIFQTEIQNKYNYKKIAAIIEGGKERQDSVFNGIKYLFEKNIIENSKDIILIHDGARPFIDNTIIDNAIKKAIENQTAIVGVFAKDTIKTIKHLDENNIIYETTLDRSKLIQVQTPQVFNAKLIYDAFLFAKEKKFYSTDDAGVLEFYAKQNNMDININYSTGNYFNIKITTPEDMIFAKAIYNSMK